MSGISWCLCIPWPLQSECLPVNIRFLRLCCSSFTIQHPRNLRRLHGKNAMKYLPKTVSSNPTSHLPNRERASWKKWSHIHIQHGVYQNNPTYINHYIVSRKNHQSDKILSTQPPAVGQQRPFKPSLEQPGDFSHAPAEALSPSASFLGKVRPERNVQQNDSLLLQYCCNFANKKDNVCFIYCSSNTNQNNVAECSANVKK